VKYICMGYLDVKAWEAKSPAEQQAAMDACFAYDEELRRTGAWVSGEALGGPEAAATLRLKGDKVSVTDGPYAETKELLGGLLILEARDLNHAIQIMSKHPGTKMGPWEIHGTVDITPVVEESRKRRTAAAR
jgi:hypothetical protein